MAAVVSAVKANGQILKDSVIDPSGNIPDPKLIAARIIVIITHHHKIPAPSDEYSPAVLRRRNKCRRDVLGDVLVGNDVLGFLKWRIGFSDWTAVAVGASMNIIHPSHQIVVLHGGLRKTDLVDRSQLFRRNQIEFVGKSSDRLVAKEGEG